MIGAEIMANIFTERNEKVHLMHWGLKTMKKKNFSKRLFILFNNDLREYFQRESTISAPQVYFPTNIL